MADALVIENNSGQGPGRLADWLADAGMDLTVVRPHTGEPIPADAGGFDALVALGGGRGVAWAPQLTDLLRRAVAARTPTLALCSSARALATAYGGVTEPVTEYAPGPRLLARRDIAMEDQLFNVAPMGIDVIWWRREEITELPPEATLLASSPHGTIEIFRIGDRAWGIQSHVEFTPAAAARLDGFTDESVARVAAVQEHLEETWRPISARFAALAAGSAVGSPLPLLGE